MRQVWRDEVAPSLAELEELVREATWRQVFFDSVSGDLRLYAGPATALAVASATEVSTAVAAVVGVGAPVLKLAATKREREKAAARHELFYLRELGARLGRRT